MVRVAARPGGTSEQLLVGHYKQRDKTPAGLQTAWVEIIHVIQFLSLTRYAVLGLGDCLK